MILDSNLLLYAADQQSPHHVKARDWLQETMRGQRQVGLPWLSILSFLRISTHPRIMSNPLTPSRAWSAVDAWLEADPVWIPAPTPRHADVLKSLMIRHHITGSLTSDVHLAALGVEHGLPVYSADTDFARFGEIDWVNPLAP